MENSTIIEGFKGFDQNMKCRGHQFKEGEIYEIDGKPVFCQRGFHFCKMPLDVLEFYPATGNPKFAHVEAIGDVIDDDVKSVTNRIRIGASISLPMLFKIHFEKVKEIISKSSTTNNVTGDRGHASATGYRGHASATGYNSIAASLGIHGRACTKNGWIVLADWRYIKSEWKLMHVLSFQAGQQVDDLVISENTWYWFEEGKLNHSPINNNTDESES